MDRSTKLIDRVATWYRPIAPTGGCFGLGRGLGLCGLFLTAVGTVGGPDGPDDVGDLPMIRSAAIDTTATTAAPDNVITTRARCRRRAAARCRESMYVPGYTVKGYRLHRPCRASPPATS